MAYRLKASNTDADRDVVANIFSNGGPCRLVGAACIIELAQKMLQSQASSVKLKLAILEG